jgi:hypothetical protein
MNDLSHYIGSDLNLSITGDLQRVDGTVKGQQRVLRRLLTNPGDYMFHPTYGAGLAAQVGAVADMSKITALIRGQILLEDAVAQVPEPQIMVSAITNGISVYIKYTDAVSKTAQVLSFDVSK